MRLAGIRKDVLEVEAGFRSRLLSDLEHRASLQVQTYMDHVRETRALWNTISQTHPGALACSHALYEDYQKHKVERDSIASVIQENPKLYTPFLRVCLFLFFFSLLFDGFNILPKLQLLNIICI